MAILPFLLFLVVNLPAAPRPIAGTFYTLTWQPKLVSVQQWRDEFQAMRDVGCTLLIPNLVAADHWAEYPSVIPWLSSAPDIDPLDTVLTAADGAGISVWLGGYYSSLWYNRCSDSIYLTALADSCVQVFDELYLRYRRHPSLRGWYDVHEIANGRSLAGRVHLYASFYGRLARWAHDATGLTYSVAPWFDSTSQTNMSPDETSQFWQSLLAETEIDVLMLQDGIGCHRFRFDPEAETYPDLRPYFQAVHAACDAQIRPRTFWADVEVFDMDRTNSSFLYPGNIDTIAVQLRSEQELVEGAVMFQFHWFMSPLSGAWPASVYGEYQALIRGATNKAQGRDYTISRPCDVRYPDIGQLTDGIKSDWEAACVGWAGSESIVVDVPLASACTLECLKCFALESSAHGALTPDSIRFSALRSDTLVWQGASQPVTRAAGLRKVLFNLPEDVCADRAILSIYPHPSGNQLTLLSEIEAIGRPGDSDIREGRNTPDFGAFQLTPNPSRGRVDMRLPGAMKNGAKLTVCDASGREVVRTLIGTGRTWIRLNLSRLPSGIYFVALERSEKRYCRKVVLLD